LVARLADTLGFDRQNLLILAHPEFKELITEIKSEKKRKTSPSWGSVLTWPLLGSVNSDCNTAISIAGANLPVWMLCRIVGILVSVSLRPLFVTTGIDEWMTPRPFIYSGLALIVALVCWLLVRK